MLDQPAAVDACLLGPLERVTRAVQAPAHQRPDRAGLARAADAAAVARRAFGRLRRGGRVELDDLVHPAMVAAGRAVRSIEQRGNSRPDSGQSTPGLSRHIANVSALAKLTQAR